MAQREKKSSFKAFKVAHKAPQHVNKMVFLMFISFGFSLPLLVLLMVEILWGVILMTPPPFNIPAIKLAELTYTRTGTTVGTWIPCLRKL